jgi:hypothetical protein
VSLQLFFERLIEGFSCTSPASILNTLSEQLFPHEL